jgi:hypothetical protein
MRTLQARLTILIYFFMRCDEHGKGCGKARVNWIGGQVRKANQKMSGNPVGGGG